MEAKEHLLRQSKLISKFLGKLLFHICNYSRKHEPAKHKTTKHAQDKTKKVNNKHKKYPRHKTNKKKEKK